MDKKLNHSPAKRTLAGLHFDMIIQDHIAFVYFKISHMTIEMARQIVAERTAFMEPIAYPVMIDLTNLLQVDDETMLFMAGEGASKLVTCAAFLIKSEINELTFDTFRQFKPKVPIKAFHVSQKDEALRWLKYMSNNN